MQKGAARQARKFVKPIETFFIEVQSLQLYRQFVKKVISNIPEGERRDEILAEVRRHWVISKEYSEEQKKTLVVNGHWELKKLDEMIRFMK
jgi:hypothetical protein